jgi:hypothetical protein
MRQNDAESKLIIEVLDKPVVLVGMSSQNAGHVFTFCSGLLSSLVRDTVSAVAVAMAAARGWSAAARNGRITVVAVVVERVIMASTFPVVVVLVQDVAIIVGLVVDMANAPFDYRSMLMKVARSTRRVS